MKKVITPKSQIHLVEERGYMHQGIVDGKWQVYTACMQNVEPAKFAEIDEAPECSCKACRSYERMFLGGRECKK